MEDGISLRKEAENHALAGDFDEWYESRRKDRERGIKPVSGHKGVTWDRVHKDYVVTISHNGKTAYLGRVKDLEDGISLRMEAENHVLAGDFEEWCESRKKDRGLRIKNPGSGRKPVSGHTGIYRSGKSKNFWMAFIAYNKKNIYLGRSRDVEVVRKLRLEAEQHILDGDFEEWYESLPEEREPDRKPASGYPGVYTTGKSKGVWSVFIVYNKKNIYLGRTKDLEVARKLRLEAEQHVASGDFEEWLQARKSKNRKP